jgi:hypothetical protein
MKDLPALAIEGMVEIERRKVFNDTISRITQVITGMTSKEKAVRDTFNTKFD